MKNPNIWYLDSGATEHMTPHFNKMNSFKKTLVKVQMANKQKIQALGKGDITLQFSYKNGGLRADLNDVLFIPNLGRNILSVGRLVEKGLKIIFENAKACIYKSNGQVILKAFRKNRLYEIEEQTQYGMLADRNLLLGDGYEDESIKERIKLATRQNKNNDDVETYSMCTYERTKMCIYSGSCARSEFLLMLVHCNLVGPIEPPSQGGSKYFLSFIDDSSRYTVVFPIKSTTEVLMKFDEFRRMSEGALGHKIQALMMDIRSSILSKDLEEYLTNHKISLQFTVPRVPHQSSIAEIMNEKLLNITEYFMVESGVPKELWADAIVTACYVMNKCPSVAIDRQIPEELWTGRKVCTDHLRVFGCKAWITLEPGVISGNLEIKAIECIFIGYSDEVNSYKLWNRKQNIFFISKDVKFDENCFPCKVDYAEDKLRFNKPKSNIMKVENFEDTDKFPIKCSNITENKDICQSKVSENELKVTYKKLQSDEEDKICTTKENSLQNIPKFNKKHAKNRNRGGFKFHSKYFARKKVFPLYNSKQKLIKGFRSNS